MFAGIEVLGVLYFLSLLGWGQVIVHELERGYDPNFKPAIELVL